ncbi:MAG: asparagine synthase (glutamine-hydrolyzing) [Candidatus Cloacimonetes bacterium]|nr:asparagine synthase (glutamine-hydrolyzing) [Candidatus Cloacimonadota bacterium]
MCGITGIYNFDKDKSVDKELLQRMTDAISHRGPDNQGIFIDRNCGLGLRRLSIIDTTEQKQPILTNEDEILRIAFNGEIYNFLKLKKQLLAKGHKFYSKTDSEVILHLYEEEGKDVVKRLNGMFAIAIYDASRAHLLLARDHLGIKPLYYCEHNGTFYFSSEIKAILENSEIPREVDPISLDLYMNYRFVPAPRTMFKGIYKLLPGHLMLVNEKGARIKEYWGIQKDIASTDFLSQSDTDKLEEEKYATRAVRELLTKSIKMQLISDVPLGAFLSGGIDSSIVVGTMSKLMCEPVKTFSIGFTESQYDESYFARQIAKKFQTEHQEIILSPAEVKLLPKIIWHLDEPLADPAAVPMFLLAREASKKVKVVLTGEGGDELFAGYKENFPYHLASLFSILPKNARLKLAKIVARLPGVTGKTRLYRSILPEKERAQHILYDIFRFTDKRKLYPPTRQVYSSNFLNSLNFFDQRWEKVKDWDWLSAMQYLETKIWLDDDPLLKADKMLMANSLEGRVPILDYRLVELAFSIPWQLRAKNGVEKYILRQAFADILPQDIFARKKQAFEIPIKKWLREDLKFLIDESLSKKEIEKVGFFQWTEIEKILATHYSGKKDFAYEIWALLCFQLWHKIFIQ